MMTLAEALAQENELLRRRFVHATRPRGPPTLEEAIKLCKHMDGETEPDRPKPNG